MLITFDTDNTIEASRVRDIIATICQEQAGHKIAPRGDAVPVITKQVRRSNRKPDPSHLTVEEVAIVDQIRKGINRAIHLRRHLKMKSAEWGYHIARLRRLGLVKMTGRSSNAEYTID
jgi:hypothetical protein